MTENASTERSTKSLSIALTLLFVVLAFLLFSPMFGVEKTINRKTREKSAVTQLVAALRQYKTEYGDFPRGDHATILNALQGNNPRKIIFYEASPNYFNEKGELVDQWRTPYRIEFDTSPVSPHVSSAGKNKTFEGVVKNSDDILSWN